MRSRVGALDPSGLVGLEQLQAVLQPGGETWEVWEPFWQGSSRSANGCPLVSLGEHLGLEDHVHLLLSVANELGFYFPLPVSICPSW